MDDLRKRAEALKTESAINIYKKALGWQELAMDALERSHATAPRLRRPDAERSWEDGYTAVMKRSLAWILIAIMLVLLVMARENIPTWLTEYNHEAARGNDDLEWLSQP
jgi:hypothetical protein